MGRATAKNSQRIARSFYQASKRSLTKGHRTKRQVFNKAVSDSNRGLWRGR